MNLLLRVFGPPHEALHLLALLLIGRRAVHFTLRQVDIPGDLTTRQYVFVAGLPALVFSITSSLGVIGLVLAHTWTQTGLGLVVGLLGTIALYGTVGDLQLIAARLTQEWDAKRESDDTRL
jgi:hypothetical protein